jgi:hypothetical protein
MSGKFPVCNGQEAPVNEAWRMRNDSHAEARMTHGAWLAGFVICSFNCGLWSGVPPGRASGQAGCQTKSFAAIFRFDIGGEKPTLTSDRES